MANVSLLWNKPSDEGTLSGGSWVGSLPLANLLSQDVQRMARSTNAATTSTRFRVDLGAGNVSVLSQFILLNHNGSSAAKWRVVVTADPADANPAARAADTGLQPMILPTVVFGSMPWGVFPWDGVDLAAYPAGALAFILLPQPVVGRYIWVYVEDAANADGYFQAGRFLAGQAWSPRVNVNYGASIGFMDMSEARRTLGGRRIVREGPRFRVFRMTFEALTKAEAFGTAFEMCRQLGKAGDFFLSLDPEEGPEFRFRQSIYAALADTEPVVTPYFDTWTWSLAAEELI